MGFMGRRPVYEKNSRDPMIRMLRMRSDEEPLVLPISARSRARTEVGERPLEGRIETSGYGQKEKEKRGQEKARQTLTCGHRATELGI